MMSLHDDLAPLAAAVAVWRLRWALAAELTAITAITVLTVAWRTLRASRLRRPPS